MACLGKVLADTTIPPDACPDPGKTFSLQCSASSKTFRSRAKSGKPWYDCQAGQDLASLGHHHGRVMLVVGVCGNPEMDSYERWPVCIAIIKFPLEQIHKLKAPRLNF